MIAVEHSCAYESVVAVFLFATFSLWMIVEMFRIAGLELAERPVHRNERRAGESEPALGCEPVE